MNEPIHPEELGYPEDYNPYQAQKKRLNAVIDHLEKALQSIERLMFLKAIPGKNKNKKVYKALRKYDKAFKTKLQSATSLLARMGFVYEEFNDIERSLLVSLFIQNLGELETDIQELKLEDYWHLLDNIQDLLVETKDNIIEFYIETM